MNTALGQLLEVSGPPLGPRWQASEEILGEYGVRGRELRDLLRRRNGFYSFERALHVLPLGQCSTHMDLARWNDLITWRGAFGEMIDRSLLFFAEDAFGMQFALDEESIFTFDSETGQCERMCQTLEDWAAAIIGESNFYTGLPLMVKWQMANSALRDGERLIPKMPFILGGEYEAANLYAGEIVEAMQFRASLAQQLKDVPDGTKFKLTVRHHQPNTDA